MFMLQTKTSDQEDIAMSGSEEKKKKKKVKKQKQVAEGENNASEAPENILPPSPCKENEPVSVSVFFRSVLY